MRIKRTAIIVGSPGDPRSNNYCAGVTIDVNNYRKLLLSNSGGAWAENEIIILENPSHSDLIQHINRASVGDYLFFAFSGHGWYSRPSETHVLELTTDQQIGHTELLSGPAKRTIVLDCCKQAYNQQYVAKFAEARESFARRRASDKDRCLRIFEEGVSITGAAPVIMSSCSIGETSQDNSETGGLYSRSLFNIINAWVGAEEAKVGISGLAMFNVVEAHNGAAVLTVQQSGNKQNPTIQKPRSGPYAPIAVFG